WGRGAGAASQRRLRPDGQQSSAEAGHRSGWPQRERRAIGEYAPEPGRWVRSSYPTLSGRSVVLSTVIVQRNAEVVHIFQKTALSRPLPQQRQPRYSAGVLAPGRTGAVPKKAYHFHLSLH